MKRSIAWILALGMLATSLGGCRLSDADGASTIRLKIWGSQDDQTMLREMCNAFAEANPDKEYSFTFGVVGEGDAKKMLLDDPDAAADIFHFSDDQLRDLVTAGALAQIGGEYRQTVESENSPDSVQAATVDEKLYAFPATADNGYFLYYNKAVFDTPPDTLEEILAACTGNRKFAMKLSDAWYLAAFFLTAGCEFSEEQTIDWANDRGLAALRAANALCHDSRFIHFGTDYDASLLSGFGNGTVVAGVSGTWNAEKIANEIGEENLGATKLPKIVLDGEEVQMRGFAGYKLIGVNAASDTPQEAVRLAAFLTNEENQMKRFTDRAMGPTNRNAAASDAVRANEPLSAIAEQLQYSVSQDRVPNAFWTAGEGLGSDLVSGTVSDDALPGLLQKLVESVNHTLG